MVKNKPKKAKLGGRCQNWVERFENDWNGVEVNSKSFKMVENG